MRNSKLPVTVKRWVDANPHIVESVEIEEDEWGEAHEGPWSMWIYFQPGWINTATECHMIHEPTAKCVLEHATMIKPCDCDDCTELRAVVPQDEVRTEPELRNPIGELI
jgi:hypothetical protein